MCLRLISWNVRHGTGSQSRGAIAIAGLTSEGMCGTNEPQYREVDNSADIDLIL